MGCGGSTAKAASSPSEVRAVPPSPAPAPRPTELPTPVQPIPSSIQSPIPSKPIQSVPEAPKAVENHAVVPPVPVVEPKPAEKVEPIAAPVTPSPPVTPVHHEPTPEPPPPVRTTNKPPPPAEEPVHTPVKHPEPVVAPPAPVPAPQPVVEKPVETKPVAAVATAPAAPIAHAAPAPPAAAPEPVVHAAPVAPAAVASTVISPNVGFVIKTRDTNSGEKIFINILYHEKVVDMIPVDAKESTDKKGEKCLAYSVVLASSLFQLSHKYDSPEINNVSLSSIALINRTYNISLDTDYKIPRMKRGFVGDEVEDVALPAPAPAAPAASPKAVPAPAVVHAPEPVVAAAVAPTPKVEQPTATDAETKVKVPHAPVPAPAAPVAAPAPAEPVKEVKKEEEQQQEPLPAENTPTVAPAAAPKTEEPVPVVHHTPVEEVKAVPAPAAAPASPTATDHTVDVVLPAPKPVPPKMHGWLKKRGHVVLNWKSRYFVLDNGYLTYFVDKLDHPPYGKDMKGQLCLAGYREVPITEETAGSSASKRNTSAAEEALWTNRLHLVYDPALFDSEGTQTKSSTNNEEDYQDLLLEAASPDEKAAWLSAINAHTEYFESTLTLGASLLGNNTSAAGGASSAANSPAHGNRSSTMSVAGAPRLQSISGRNSTSTYSVVDDNKRWMIFLHSGEEIVLTGLTAKPNPMGIHLMRQLILTSHKRLLYIDGKTMEQKGEIEWSNDITAAYPQIKLIDDTTFEIAESAKKTYKFITKDMSNAKDWVHAVETTVRK